MSAATRDDSKPDLRNGTRLVQLNCVIGGPIRRSWHLEMQSRNDWLDQLMLQDLSSTSRLTRLGITPTFKYSTRSYPILCCILLIEIE